MRNIIVSMFMTLDGVIEAPEKWSFQFWNEEAGKFKVDELFATDTLLLGRVTYQGFAAAWPSRTDEEGFADRINSLPKFVLSTTLDEVEWNNSRLIKENVAEEIRELKQRAGQDILVYGGAGLVHTLMQHDLIDEYRLMLYPLVLGSGLRLFKNGSNATLKLVDTKTFNSGIVVLTYHPAEQDG